MSQPEIRIKNPKEFKVNQESEKDFSKIYEETCEEEIYV